MRWKVAIFESNISVMMDKTEISKTNSFCLLLFSTLSSWFYLQLLTCKYLEIIINFWTILHKTDPCVNGWMMLLIYNSIVGFCWTVLVQLALGLWTHVENWFSSQRLSHPTAPRQSQSTYSKYYKHWLYIYSGIDNWLCML